MASGPEFETELTDDLDLIPETTLSPAERLARRLFPTDFNVNQAYETIIQETVFPLFETYKPKWGIHITQLTYGYYWINLDDRFTPGTRDFEISPRLNSVPSTFLVKTLKTYGFTVDDMDGITVSLPVPASHTNPKASCNPEFETHAERIARQLFPAIVSDSDMGPAFKKIVEDTVFPLFEPVNNVIRQGIIINTVSIGSSDSHHWYDAKNEGRSNNTQWQISPHLNRIPLIFITNVLRDSGFNVSGNRSSIRVTLPIPE